MIMKLADNKNSTFYNWRSYRWRYVWKNFKCLIWAFKCAWQRMLYGFSVSDVWDMDSWFYKTIPAMLRYLRDHTSSFPPDYQEKYGEDGFEKWKDTLTEMADYIEAGGDHQCHLGKTREQIEAMEEIRKAKFKYGMKLMTQYMDSLWD